MSRKKEAAVRAAFCKEEANARLILRKNIAGILTRLETAEKHLRECCEILRFSTRPRALGDACTVLSRFEIKLAGLGQPLNDLLRSVSDTALLATVLDHMLTPEQRA